jgi:ribonuclease Z
VSKYARRAFRLVLLLALVWLPTACEGLQDRLISGAAARAVAVDRSEWFSGDALHVVLCGTGSPLADADRAGPCTAVIAGDAFFVVDVGPGSTESLMLDRLPIGRLSGVFLTHFHSDHIGELGEINMQSWALGGRTTPLSVYGPPGVQRVVGGFAAAYALDREYRVAHHGEDIIPPTGGLLYAKVFEPAEDGSAVTVFEADGLKVSAVLVDHRPIVPAVAYRFDYKGRSVVISGDTVASDTLARLADGGDLLVHEVLAGCVLKIASEAAYEIGRDRMGKLAADVVDYHTSPRDAVEIARQAGVDTIVFSHLVPAVPGPLVSWIFMRGVDDTGDVEVVVGEDGMHFRMPIDSEEIELESL